jgi:diadenosine tetraphosphate (Ap4A) HIT family hydrolase
MSAVTAIHRRVAALREGRDPTFLARMPSGWAVLGEQQFLRGYCLLLPDPVMPHLNALAGRERAGVLADAAALGDAVLAATAAVRINYAIFGNVEPALHVHVVPRFGDEPEAMRTAQPWAYDWAAAPRFDPLRDRELVAALRRELERRP